MSLENDVTEIKKLIKETEGKNCLKCGEVLNETKGCPVCDKVEEKKPVKKWMQKAFGKNKGGLHRALDVDPNKTIPKGKLDKATHAKDAHVRHMAQAAKNANESVCKGCGGILKEDEKEKCAACIAYGQKIS